MGGREVETTGFGNTAVDPIKLRKLAVHCADRVAAEHPHELDELMPRLAGRLTAHDPTARADLLLLLDAIGYLDHHRRTP